MKKKTANKRISIERVKNLYMDNKTELDIITSIHVKEVENLYIGKAEPTTSATKYDESPTAPHQPSIAKLTNSQLVLVCYYILLSWGLRFRINVDVADVARLIHGLLGKPYQGVDKSDFYKKLLQAPHFKSKRGLIKDLAVVQNLFLHLELKEASLLVEKEITIVGQEINKPHT